MSEQDENLLSKLQTVKAQVQVALSYTRELLEKQKQNRAENANVQEILTLNRIDDAVNRTIALKLKAKSFGL